ncbi:hypothetical protein BH11ACT3_BH11ACT3_04200 [soil metagenome]
MRWMPRRLRADDGSILPLISFYGALALILVLIVAAVTSLYLERKRLFTLADGAALVGAESFTLDEVVVVAGHPHVELQSDEVRGAVQSYLGGNPIGRFEGLALVEATTRDGRSATVTVSSVWHPPVVTLFVPDGLRIEATAVSRTVFG